MYKFIFFYEHYHQKQLQFKNTCNFYIFIHSYGSFPSIFLVAPRALLFFSGSFFLLLIPARVTVVSTNFVN